MKRTHVLLLALISMLIVAGCQETATLTGSVGERQVVGTIVPAGDLNGADPAGIQIRVREQGVEAITTSTGAFVLTGLPEGELELQFLRSEDGINATLQLSPGVNQVTVELEKGRASTRRRSARAPRIQLEGLITAISADSITVADASRKMDVTAAIDDDTLIRKGHRKLTTDDLEVGDRVHVRARPEADGSLTAEEIKLQEDDDDGDDDDRPAKKELEGLILAVSSDSITVNDASSGEQTAAITADTVIRKGNTSLTTDDLKPGDRVHVRAKVEDDDSLTAEEIKLQNPGK